MLLGRQSVFVTNLSRIRFFLSFDPKSKWFITDIILPLLNPQIGWYRGPLVTFGYEPLLDL